ncbi:hypothetical protein BaRGS_00017709 [Batillaria attramentaria]|uniref:Transmembrane protein 192 n=1 Tax=Batillaria attramentaria TaxID=370345 RepID=A0ABD0KVS9_9CAEN
MVSLSSNFRQPGGTFFGEESNNSNADDDPLIDTMPILPHEPVVNQWMAEEMKKFRAIKTPKAILLAKFLYICLALAAYLLPVLCKDKKCGEEATTLVQYIHGAMWFLLFLVHHYLNYEHNNSLLHGYFNFHLETRSLPNAILVVLSKVLDTACGHKDSCKMFTKAHYLQLLISLEVIIALIFLVIYLVKTLRFNKAKEVPDFMRSSTAPHTLTTSHEVGYRPSYETQKNKAITLMWYEIYFWRQKRRDLCVDIIHLNDKLEQIMAQNELPPAFDFKSWSMGQCWNEVYQLRSGYTSLLKERQNLVNRLKDNIQHERLRIN